MTIPETRSNGGERGARGPSIARNLRTALHAIPLGITLGLITAAIVLSAIGVLLFVQNRRAVLEERIDRQKLLGQTLVPLAQHIEAATDKYAIGAALRAFVTAQSFADFPRIRIRLLARDATVAQSVRGRIADAPKSAVISSMRAVVSPALPQGQGLISIEEEDRDFAREIAQRTRDLLLDLGIAALALLLGIHGATSFLVTKPLREVEKMVRRMELGYWGEVEPPPGALEIRSLALKFGQLGRNLEHLFESLVFAVTKGAVRTSERTTGVTHSGVDGDRRLIQSEQQEVSGENASKLKRIADALAIMELGDRSDPAVQQLARESWDYLATEADRIGACTLKARLEDSALRILRPQVIEPIRARLAEDTRSTAEWIGAQWIRLAQVVSEKGVEVLAIEHRIKHAAGIWRKMESKDLPLELVQDVFAFRIIVPDITSCYVALQALHERMSPKFLRFKDYIASPKPNGYQSIHTCLYDEYGSIFEVQIRTPDMHRNAESGQAAHWLHELSKSMRRNSA
jgi:HAMP domain-containing protein